MIMVTEITPIILAHKNTLTCQEVIHRLHADSCPECRDDWKTLVEKMYFECTEMLFPEQIQYTDKAKPLGEPCGLIESI